jgi:hypothetical protein
LATRNCVPSGTLSGRSEIRSKVSLVLALSRWQDKSDLAKQRLTAISAEKREEAATATRNGVEATNAAKGQIAVFATCATRPKKRKFRWRK